MRLPDVRADIATPPASVVEQDKPAFLKKETSKEI
jgi:hypothetical protein